MEAIHQAIYHVSQAKDLSPGLMADTMREIMSGQATSAQIAGLLVGLSAKGETVDEIVAAAQVMRELASPLTGLEQPLTDIVGTGGDGASLFNVSTAASFVAAAGGARIAKHGNRSVSSKSGAADVLEAAGVRLDLPADKLQAAVNSIGIGFLFAPMHHSAMRHAVEPRRDLGIRTLFNLLGPMTNPASASRQVLGVYDRKWIRPLAEALAELGSEHVLVIHSRDGLDEFSIAAPTDVAELHNGQVSEWVLEPAELDLSGSLEGLQVADATQSLGMIRSALSGQPGPAADMIAMNAGAALYVAGVADCLRSGVVLAQQVLAEGRALKMLQAYADWSQTE